MLPSFLCLGCVAMSERALQGQGHCRGTSTKVAGGCWSSARPFPSAPWVSAFCLRPALGREQCGLPV